MFLRETGAPCRPQEVTERLQGAMRQLEAKDSGSIAALRVVNEICGTVRHCSRDQRDGMEVDWTAVASSLLAVIPCVFFYRLAPRC